MRIFSNLSLSLLAASSLALTGCQQFTKPQLDPNTIQTESDQHFSLQGKIGVRTPEQTGSAFLHGYNSNKNLILNSVEF
jgi:outer membrane lipoprotein LolB